MVVNSSVLIALVLIGATVPSFAEEEPKQTFTCTAKTFNECLMEAPCSAWKKLGPKGYQLVGYWREHPRADSSRNAGVRSRRVPARIAIFVDRPL